MPQTTIFLDDLLRDPRGFREAILALARPFRDKLGLPDVVDEIGVVCPDVIGAAAHLERSYPGMGPFLLARGQPRSFREVGTEIIFRTSVGFGYYQDVLIELAEPGDGSPLFATHADNNRITVHHLGFFAEGDDLTREVDGERRTFRTRFEALGYQPRWEALVAAAGVSGHVTIFETYEAADNLAIEFLDIRLLRGPDGEGGHPFSLASILPALAHLQSVTGPRVFVLPGDAGEEVRKRWSLQWIVDFDGMTPEQLWPWMTDPERMSRWGQAIVFLSAESEQKGLLPDTEGAIREVWLRPLKPKGKPRPEQRPHGAPFLREQVRSVERPAGGTWKMRYGILSGGGVAEQSAEVALEPTQSGCRLRWEVDLVPAIPGTGPLLLEIVDRGTRESLEVLETLLSHGEPQPPDRFAWGVLLGLLLGAGVAGHLLRLVLLAEVSSPGADGRHTVAAIAVALYGLAALLVWLRKNAGLYITILGPLGGLTAIALIPKADIDLFQIVLGVPQFLAAGIGVVLLAHAHSDRRSHAHR